MTGCFRASGLPLLEISNERMASDQQKIASGKALSPLLLVRDLANRKLIIADGYHRLCAVYSVDENQAVPCSVV